MKLTKSKLREIIKQEIRTLNERSRMDYEFASSSWMGDSGYPYRLILQKSEYDSDRYSVRVQRDFNNNDDWSGVPSGWYYDDVKGLSTLTIDGGQNWTVDVPRRAWRELENFVN